MKLSRRFGITVILLSGALAVSGSNGLRTAKPLAHPLGSIAGRIGNWIGTAPVCRWVRISWTTRSQSEPTRSILLTKASRGTP